jgi:hypothetical protein
MERWAAPILAGVVVVLLGFGFCAADEDAKIPLGSVYTTTGQQDTKDAGIELRNAPQPFGEFSGLPVVFLVNGKDFLAAVKASRPFLELGVNGKAPAPKAESKSSGTIWVGACLGSDGSVPPAYRLHAVEIKGKKIRVTYAFIEREISTGDEHPYLLWAPLGKLPAGEYTLELYDTTTKKVTVTRKSKVFE